MDQRILAFRKKTESRWFNLFLLQKIPLAFLAGVKVRKFNDDAVTTSMKFKWMNQNPFKSMYFAAMQMGAELSSGLLLYQYLQTDLDFSMLLTAVRADFDKKAIGEIQFQCSSAQMVADSIERLETENVEVLELPVKATNQSGEIVASFTFCWSIKKRSKR